MVGSLHPARSDMVLFGVTYRRRSRLPMRDKPLVPAEVFRSPWRPSSPGSRLPLRHYPLIPSENVVAPRAHVRDGLIGSLLLVRVREMQREGRFAPNQPLSCFP